MATPRYVVILTYNGDEAVRWTFDDHPECFDFDTILYFISYERWEGIAPYFSTSLASEYIKVASISTSTQKIQQIQKDVEKRLREHQLSLYSQIAAEFSKVGTLQSATRKMTGAKSLLDAYIALGMSKSLEENDYLRSLLYGSERVPDEAIIQSLYRNVLDSRTDNKPLDRVNVDLVISPRVEALTRVLLGILGEIEQYHRDKQRDPVSYNYPQSLSSVDSTLQELQVHNPEVILSNPVAAHPQAVNTHANEGA